jgi:exodeoxyribonuclease VII large subunit
MDLIDEPDKAGNTPEFTVSELSGAVKRAIEGEFGHVRVKGEVGRVVRARSGHLYFDLKDDRAVLACTTWKGQISGLSVMPEEGMEVVAHGRMTTFANQSKYQMNATEVAVAGVGALMAMLEKRRKALQAEGLFAPERKRALPFLPQVIGVVTSAQGAVIRDILHRLRERFPRRVLVWPVAVQGRDCAPQVARAIAGFNAMTPGGALPRPDLLIVARGGGSIEDLWGFNEEEVVRAAAQSAIPLISAVGHETDTTLIDHAADRRAPTPSAAAEIAVPVRLELIGTLEQLDTRMNRAVTEGLRLRKQRVGDLGRLLPRPETLAEEARQRLDYWSEKLDLALKGRVSAGQLRLSNAAGSLRPGLLQARLDRARERQAGWADRLAPALDRAARRKREAFDLRAGQLKPTQIRRVIVKGHEDVQARLERLRMAARTAQDRRTARLEALESLRRTLGYTETLRRGYAVVRGDGAVVTTARAAGTATALELEFTDGKLALDKREGPKPKPPRSKTPPPDQGSLF